MLHSFLFLFPSLDLSLSPIQIIRQHPRQHHHRRRHLLPRYHLLPPAPHLRARARRLLVDTDQQLVLAAIADLAIGLILAGAPVLVLILVLVLVLRITVAVMVIAVLDPALGPLRVAVSTISSFRSSYASPI
jgi:hypothetical protein